MKKVITVIFLIILCLCGFAQKDSIPKIDSVYIGFSVSDLRLVYEALNESNLPHQQVIKLLAYLEQEFRIQTITKNKK